MPSENDIMRQVIEKYKDAKRGPAQDLNFDFLVRTLKSVNLSSEVKIARNPIDEKHEWVSGTVLMNVGKLFVDDDGNLTLTAKSDNSGLTADKMLQRIDKLAKKTSFSDTSPVMLAVSDDKKVQLTEAYSHSFVKDIWAGLPFDVVLGYLEKDDPVPEQDGDAK